MWEQDGCAQTHSSLWCLCECKHDPLSSSITEGGSFGAQRLPWKPAQRRWWGVGSDAPPPRHAPQASSCSGKLRILRWACLRYCCCLKYTLNAPLMATKAMPPCRETRPSTHQSPPHASCRKSFISSRLSDRQMTPPALTGTQTQPVLLLPVGLQQEKLQSFNNAALCF